LARVRGEVNRLLPLLRLPEGRWRKQRSRRWSGARTCNLAVWREDLLAINGFDEGFEGWGHEDADLVVRLFRLGRRRKQGHFAVPVLHLWHHQNDRSKEPANWARLQQVLGNREAMRATPGLNQYLPPRQDQTGAKVTPKQSYQDCFFISGSSRDKIKRENN
jgi:hypothetical protein